MSAGESFGMRHSAIVTIFMCLLVSWLAANADATGELRTAVKDFSDQPSFGQTH
jgi:hypothetical protein